MHQHVWCDTTGNLLEAAATSRLCKGGKALQVNHPRIFVLCTLDYRSNVEGHPSTRRVLTDW